MDGSEAVGSRVQPGAAQRAERAHGMPAAWSPRALAHGDTHAWRILSGVSTRPPVGGLCH